MSLFSPLQYQHGDSGGDAGAVFEYHCKDCNSTVQVAESQWWESSCDCGIKYELDISVIKTAINKTEDDE